MSCSNDKAGDAKSPSTPSAVAADHSSPEKAVATLIAACARGDKAAVGACFHPEAAGEFKSLLDGSVSEKDFRGLCEMFAGARVLLVEGEAVKVQLSKREETLAMKQDGEAWKVLDF
ncbi:MAG: hypothetical protein IPN34_09820 [Planctomycetes bacterium]|nr:hypothetical protein [Planctomycetota bacterium]